MLLPRKPVTLLCLLGPHRQLCRHMEGLSRRLYLVAQMRVPHKFDSLLKQKRHAVHFYGICALSSSAKALRTDSFSSDASGTSESTWDTTSPLPASGALSAPAALEFSNACSWEVRPVCEILGSNNARRRLLKRFLCVSNYVSKMLIFVSRRHF